MARTVADVFAAKGYEIVTAPGPGVLRVAPSVVDLDVYEPDVTNCATGRRCSPTMPERPR